MIDALRKEWLYSEKRPRDLLFTAIDRLIGERPPMMVVAARSRGGAVGLVASAIAERLHVEAPFEERLTAGKFELAARLASQATLGITTRIQRDAITGRYTRSIALQAAFKTVQ